MRSTRSNQRGRGGGSVLEDLGGGLGEIGLGLDQVRAGLGVFDEGGRGVYLAREERGGFGGEGGVGIVAEQGEFFNEGLGGAGVEVPGRAGGGFAELFPEQTDFGCGVGEQARDLGFEGAGADNLAERGIGGQGKQVAGDIEGARAEGALVGLGLDIFGARDAAVEQIEDGGAGALVRSKELADGFGRAGRKRRRRQSRGSTIRTRGSSGSGWSAPGRPNGFR